MVSNTENEQAGTLKVGVSGEEVVMYFGDGNYIRMPAQSARSLGNSLMSAAARAEGKSGGHIFTFETTT